jgi:uncharacterized protein
MMTMTSFKRSAAGLLALLSATLLSACAAPRARLPRTASEGAPALWRIADADSEVWLFGTIHLLPEGVEWRTPVFDAAFMAADALVIEVAMGPDPAASGQAMMAMGLAEGLPPLIERLPEDQRPLLRRSIDASGVPEALLDRMRTWTAALTLAAGAFRQLGLEGAHGADHLLHQAALGAGKPVRGLETVEEQFGFFAGLSEDSQRAFLSAVAQETGDMRAQFQAMLDAWLRGDTDAIARTFDTEIEAHPELYGVLMTQRNRRWAEWIERRLVEPGSTFIAVGAGHLAGRDSVQDMLALRGIRAERVQ